MPHPFVGVSFGIAILSSLVGCVGEPPPSAQALVTRAQGGHWSDCLESIARGVEGDHCAFRAEDIGTAMLCATALPPEIVGWDTIGGQRVPIAEAQLDVFAHCSAGRLVLDRRHDAEGPPVSGPTVTENGCLAYTLPPELGGDGRLCVEDDLLPEPGLGALVDLDRPGACEDVLDGIAVPGDVCTGDTICASVEAQHRFHRPEFVHIVGRPGTYAWCGAGRLRRASSIVELPCDHLDETRQTYLCALQQPPPR